MANMSTETSGLDLENRQVIVALVFGVVLTLVGIIGFAGVLVTDDAILGIFGITPLHNAVHLITGVVGLGVGYAGAQYSTDYNKYLGLIYLLVFVVGAIGVVVSIGFVTDTGTLALNIGWADNVLHLVIGLVLAAVGYGLGQ